MTGSNLSTELPHVVATATPQRQLSTLRPCLSSL